MKVYVKVYVASALTNRREALRLVSWLVGVGREIVSTWHDTDATPETEAGLSPEAQAAVAWRVLREVQACDELWWLYGAAGRRCGAALECGYAMALGRRVTLVPVRPHLPVPTILVHGERTRVLERCPS